MLSGWLVVRLTPVPVCLSSGRIMAACSRFNLAKLANCTGGGQHRLVACYCMVHVRGSYSTSCMRFAVATCSSIQANRFSSSSRSRAHAARAFSWRRACSMASLRSWGTTDTRSWAARSLTCATTTRARGCEVGWLWRQGVDHAPHVQAAAGAVRELCDTTGAPVIECGEGDGVPCRAVRHGSRTR